MATSTETKSFDLSSFCKWDIPAFKVDGEDRERTTAPETIAHLEIPKGLYAPFHVRATAGHLSAWFQIAGRLKETWNLVYEVDIEWHPSVSPPLFVRLLEQVPESADLLLLGCVSGAGSDTLQSSWILSALAEKKRSPPWSTAPFVAQLALSIEGTIAYLVKPRGARRLLDIAESQSLFVRYGVGEQKNSMIGRSEQNEKLACGGERKEKKADGEEKEKDKEEKKQKKGEKQKENRKKREGEEYEKKKEGEKEEEKEKRACNFFCRINDPPGTLNGLPLRDDTNHALTSVNAWTIVHPEPLRTDRTLAKPFDQDFWLDFASTGYRGFRHVQGVARRRRCNVSEKEKLLEPRIPSLRAWQMDARELRTARCWPQLLTMLSVLAMDPELDEHDQNWAIWDECIRAALECGPTALPLGRAAASEWMRRNSCSFAGRSRLRQELTNHPTRLYQNIKLLGDASLSRQFACFVSSLH